MNAEAIDIFGKWHLQEHQDAAWDYLAAGGLRACLVWHRRAGKDDVCLHHTCKAMLERVGNYWHMLPMAEQARKAIWDAINPHTGRRRIDECFPVELRRRTRNNEMMVEFLNGSIWQVVGSDNYNALVGSPPVGVVFSEWSLADPASWAYLRPILRENGGWAIFIYTPRGRNHGLSLYKSAQQAQGWFHQVISAEDSGVFTAAELAEELRELQSEYGEELGLAFFEQEYLCSFDAANIGAVYARSMAKLQRQGRICPVAHDPDYEVHTAWDFGFGDKTAIWFWQILPGPRLHIIDHYASSGQDIVHYAERIHGRLITRNPDNSFSLGAPLPKHDHRAFYRYGKHYAPHDGANKTLAAGGRSIGDQAYRLDVPMTIIPATDSNNSIGAARRTLEYCWFDMNRTESGRNSLESYHFKWDDKARTLSDEPVHDWSSHDCDAFEIIGQVWQPARADKPQEQARFLHEATADEVFWPKGTGTTKWGRERI